MNRGKRIAFLLTACCLLFAGCSAEISREQKADPSYRQVSAEEAKRMMDEKENYIILDVRTEEEFAEGHIPGAILIPDYEIEDRAPKELTDKNRLILVYCRSGNRSKTASQKLAELGYTDVVEFGGIRSWPYDIEKEN